MTMRAIQTLIPPAPESLSVWHERLLPLHTLPILPHTRQQVLLAIHHPNSTAETIARVVKQDPLLCLRLYASAHRVLQKRGNQVSHLPHLISLLGIPAVETQVNAAPHLDTPHPGLLESLLHSQFAVNLAEQLWPHRGLAADDGFFPILLALAPIWMLWHTAPQTMEQRRGLLAGKIYSQRHIDQALFGFPLQQLIQPLLIQWPLPQETREAWKISPAALGRYLQANKEANRNQSNSLTQWQDAYPQRHQQTQQLPWLITLTQLTASACCRHWLSEDTLLLESACATLAHIDRDKLLHATRKAALSTSPLSATQIHPLVRLLGKWDMDHIHPVYHFAVAAKQTEANEKEPVKEKTEAKKTSLREYVEEGMRGKAPVIKAPVIKDPEIAEENQQPDTVKPQTNSTDDLLIPSPPSSLSSANGDHNSANGSFATNPTNNSNLALLKTNQQRLLQQGSKFSNLNQLLTLLSQTLHEGLGFDASCLLILNKEKTQLRSHFSQGDNNPLSQSCIQLDAQPTLLNKLLKQPAALQLDDSNLQRLSRFLPRDLVNLTQLGQVGLMAISNQHQPLGLAVVVTKHMEKAQFNHFKQTCKATNHAIAEFARRRS